MSAYSEFFLNSRSSVVQLELLQISHPDFSKDYRIVRNSVNGVTVSGLGNYGRNLFNVSASDNVLDYYVSNTTGELVYNVVYNATGFLPVLPGQTYTASYSHIRAFYNANKVFVSGTDSGNPATFTVPAGCYWMKFTVYKNVWANFQVVQGTVLGTFVPWGQASFDYYPLKIENNGAKDDLDQSFTFSWGDLGEVLPLELDRVAASGGFGFKPQVVYHTYRSDDLAAPLFGPVLMEVESFAFNRDGSTFTVKAPSLNINKTGEIYTLERFPMLRGFL
jgi:hypothetical protein